MTKNGPDDPERNDDQDDQRLQIGSKFEGKQDVHDDGRNPKSNKHARKGLDGLLLLTFPADENSRVFLQ